MALAIGSIAKVSVGSSTANLLAPAATGGSGAVSYQYYRSTTTGFTPGSLTAISGATALALADSGLTPGTTYFYEIVATDSTSATASSAQLSVLTSAASPNPNQFAQASFLGALDMRFNGDTLPAQFDASGSGSLVGGQVVKFTTTVSGEFQVVPCTAAADLPAGVVNYNIKNAVFSPGDNLEISQAGNVIYMYAALAINRGQYVTSLPAAAAGGCNGGVVPVAGGSIPVLGQAMDSVAIGSLLRIKLNCPSTQVG